MGYVEPDRAAAALAEAETGPLSERQLLLARLSKWPLPLHREGFPLVMMWSPKSGCTTLVKWFLFQIGELDAALAYHHWVHKYRQNVFCAGEDYVARTADALLERRRPVVKLVRDPWQRAVSSYLHQAQSRLGGAKDWPGRMRARLHKVNGGKPDRQPITFRDFAKALSRKSVKQGAINAHIAEQYSKGEEAFDLRIMKLEDFTAEIRALEKDYGLPPAPVERLSQSRHHHGGKRVLMPGAADIPIDLQTFARGDSPSYDSFYDDETRSLIAVAFWNDIQRYGYAPV